MDKTAQRIKQLRREKKMTQKDLAAATGIGLSTIQGYEQGLNTVSNSSIRLLSVFFCVSEEFLRGETNNRTSDQIEIETEIVGEKTQDVDGIPLNESWTIVDRLERLVKLLREGAITAEEYEVIKRRMIG